MRPIAIIICDLLQLLYATYCNYCVRLEYDKSHIYNMRLIDIERHIM